MATYPNPKSGDEMYSDAEPAAEAPAEESSESQEGGEPEALLPKSILAGKDFKPGEEIVLQIVSVEGDSVRVKYASEPEGEHPEPHAEGEGEGPGGPPADAEMESMMA